MFDASLLPGAVWITDIRLNAGAVSMRDTALRRPKDETGLAVGAAGEQESPGPQEICTEFLTQPKPLPPAGPLCQLADFAVLQHPNPMELADPPKPDPIDCAVLLRAAYWRCSCCFLIISTGSKLFVLYDEPC